MFETQGGTRNRTRDLPKKGSGFICVCVEHWMMMDTDGGRRIGLDLSASKGMCGSVKRLGANESAKLRIIHQLGGFTTVDIPRASEGYISSSHAS